jgi:hypothetical protein
MKFGNKIVATGSIGITDLLDFIHPLVILLKTTFWRLDSVPVLG